MGNASQFNNIAKVTALHRVDEGPVHVTPGYVGIEYLERVTGVYTLSSLYLLGMAVQRIVWYMKVQGQ